MTRAAVEHLQFLIGEAFETLMATVRSLDDGDWEWVPPRGGRHIAGILGHVAGGKQMNIAHSFDGRSPDWQDPDFARQRSVPEIIDWLRDGQQRLLDRISALEDDDLTKPRTMHWGRQRETRWLIAQMITHDLFHAGEINHIRALHHEDDVWEWETADPPG
jgi:uncharacterized damage-inducible protein DinB